MVNVVASVYTAIYDQPCRITYILKRKDPNIAYFRYDSDYAHKMK